MAHGGHGCISVTANVAPAACAKMYDAAMTGDFAAARAINDTLARLHRALFLDASPAPTKYALARLGLMTDDIRLPIVTCDPAVRPEIDAAMAEAGATA
jgi:4-hydroxy-tetrahydrodipicolinate synthase